MDSLPRSGGFPAESSRATALAESSAPRAEPAPRDEDLEELVYAVSHDLREPLRIVRSFAELLDRRYKGRLSDEADEFLSYIVDGASRMQAMLDGLLAYSRVLTRGKPFVLTDCEIVFGEALARLGPALECAEARITHDPLPSILADPAQIGQLFEGLLDNALKFRADSPPRIHLSATAGADDWTFSVSDTGIGIEPRDFDRIFRIFQRLHAREEYPGFGIGLAICRRIVQRHRGRIWVESQPGQGSTFHFSIPRFGGQV